MTILNIDGLALPELKKLQKDVAKAIDGFEARRRREALSAIEAKAKELGFTISELTGGAIKKPKTASAPKYRHPEEHSVTWTGKGRQPEWIKKAEAEGTSREAFLISN